MTVYTKSMMESLAEVRGLQEDNMDLMRKAAGGSMQTIKMKDGKLKMDSFTASGIMGVYDKVNPKNKAAMEKMINSGTKAQIMKLQSLAMKATEEAELDEGKLKDLEIKGQDLEAYAKKSGGIDKADMLKVAVMLKKGDKSGALKYTKKLDTDPRDYILNLMGEDVELDEAWEIGTDEYREYLEKLTPGETNEVEEASARADAKRHMRGGGEVDPADVDTSASDEDIKAASKHIMMQMRKAISLKGTFKVEFGDKKKVKIPANIAQAVLQKYNSLKRPAEKEKFQTQCSWGLEQVYPDCKVIIEFKSQMSMG